MTPEEREEIERQVGALKELVSELEDKMARCKEDRQQQRKRHGENVESMSKYGITKFALEVLKVADNLERAAEAVKPEELEQDAELRKMHAGVLRLQKSMKEALGEFGVVQMEALDAPFNPDQHEAMFAMPMPGKEPNTIFHVMEPGYMIHERTLRAAKVGVTRE